MPMIRMDMKMMGAINYIRKDEFLRKILLKT